MARVYVIPLLLLLLPLSQLKIINNEISDMHANIAADSIAFFLVRTQWRRQLWGTGARAPLNFQI